MRKNLYGDEDAGAIWYDLIFMFLICDLGFARSPLDRCLFVRVALEGARRLVVLVLLYVDDALVLGEARLVGQVGSVLEARFPTKRGGDDYLGLEIEVDHEHGVVRVAQSAYTKKIAGGFGFADSKPKATPVTAGFNVADGDGAVGSARDIGSAPSFEIDFP